MQAIALYSQAVSFSESGRPTHEPEPPGWWPGFLLNPMPIQRMIAATWGGEPRHALFTSTSEQTQTAYGARMLGVVCVVLTLIPGITVGLEATTPDGPGQVEIIETINGMPRHQIAIPTLPHREADITLDGRVEELVWRQVPAFDNMRVYIPGIGEPGEHPTEIRLLATDFGLYVGAILYQPPDTLVERLSNRDNFINRDTFTVTLDTTGEGLFGYWFSVGLGGTQGDGKVLPERNYQSDWDGPWIAKTFRHDEGWSVEMLLPWSMMSLPKQDDQRTIGFAVSRQVSHASQHYQWPGYPYGAAQFVTALNRMTVSGVQPKQQFSIIPYTAITLDQARGDDEVRLGADLFWKPSSQLEVAATVYPDFGAVEADNVVLNLTAFETFFPEKRLFFQAGNEVFETTPRSNPGNIMRVLNNENFATTSRRIYRSDFQPGPISLLNTRRIGGTATQVSVPEGFTPARGERDLPTDLLGAAKVTGKLGNFRYGVLGAAEDDVDWLGVDALGNAVEITDSGRDFAAARIIYEHTGENRKALGYMGTLVSGPLYDAMVHGIDGHFTSGDGKWIADVQLIASDVDDTSGYGALLDVRYTQNQRIQHKFEFDYFDEDINLDDLGFLSRNDNAGFQYALLYTKPEGVGRLSDVRGAVVIRQHYNLSEGQLVDRGIFWRNSMVLPGRNTLRTALAYMPRRWEDVDSRGNGAYKVKGRWWADAQIGTDASKRFSYSASIGAYQENLGNWTIDAAAGVTFLPTNRLSLELDVRYRHHDGWVVYQGGRNFGSYRGSNWQPRVSMNWFLAPKHQIRVALQWVGVRADERGFWAVPPGNGALQPADRTSPDHDFTVSILTAQVRYRWEIAPLTDLYVVYNLGNTLPQDPGASFSDLFRDSFSDPVVENFVAKLRYRFGN